MFDSPYPFINLGKSDTDKANPYRRFYYKFYAKHRTYLVTLEAFTIGLVAIKYCDVKDKNSKRAYQKIFKDYDAPKVIGTCFYIMLDFWRKNPMVNFVFYASLREVTEDVRKKGLPDDELDQFIENYKRARFRIYRYGMLNLFSYEHFTPVVDSGNCVYILINKKEPDAASLMSRLRDYLVDNHDLIFDPDH